MRFTKNFMTYAKAKAYTKKAGIKTQIEYKLWVKGELKKSKLKFPKDKIPSNPHERYKKNWISWGNFLGTGNPAPKTRVYIRLKNLFYMIWKALKCVELKEKIFLKKKSLLQLTLFLPVISLNLKKLNQSVVLPLFM